MWPKSYKNYPKDKPLISDQVEPENGIIGCEMHDLNGWGDSVHMRKKRKRGVIATLLIALFGKVKKKH
jgi:hypothetical protein